MTSDGTFYPRVFASVTAVLLGFALIRILEPFVGPLLWAGLLAFMLTPVHDRLARLLRGRDTASSILVTLGVVLGVVGPAATLIGVFVAQTSDLLTTLQASAAQYQIQQPSDVLHLPVIDQLLHRLQAVVPVSQQQVQESAIKAGQQVLQSMVALAGSLAAGAFGAVLAVVLTLFLFFFFLRDGRRIVMRAMALVPLDDRRKDHLQAHLASVIRALVLGTLVTALAQGTLVGIGFAIAGLPSPMVFGVLSVGAALIPVVGSTIVWIPAALWCLVGGHWGLGLFLVIWGVVVVSGADNVIRPLFLSSRAKMSTLPVFVGILGGISAFGAIGAFLGPVVVALALALVAFAEEARTEATVTEAQASPVGAQAPPADARLS